MFCRFSPREVHAGTDASFEAEEFEHRLVRTALLADALVRRDHVVSKRHHERSAKEPMLIKLVSNLPPLSDLHIRRSKTRASSKSLMRRREGKRNGRTLLQRPMQLGMDEVWLDVDHRQIRPTPAVPNPARRT